VILYSKNCDFIGIGKEELSFLGFEDIDQFKEVCSDVAELFVNKPGFIYKFKNFSWIEYTLNSGSPKKNVLLKLKNGNEIETILTIKEVFLYTPVNNENLYYAVEFVHNSPQKNSDIEDDYYDPKEDVEELSISFTKNSDNDVKELEVDFADSLTTEDSPVKLKINNDEENQNEESKKISFSSDIENKEIDSPIKIKSYDEDENKQTIVPSMEEIPHEPLLLEANQVETLFDIEKCAKELGLDISLITEVINDYLENIDATLPKIQNFIETNDEISLENALYSLKGISDNLHINTISQQLTNIIQAPSKNFKKEEVEKFKIIISKFKDNFL